MVAEIIPLDHLAPQLADVYAAVREAEDPVSPRTRAVLGAIAKRMAIASWKEEEENLVSAIGATGVRVRAAIASRLEEWVERPFSLETTFHTTQLMTGHGCFPAYLYGIRRADSPQCFHCGAENDDAEHTLIECPAWMNESLLGLGTGGGCSSLSQDSRAIPGYPGGVGCIPVLLRTSYESQGGC
ncbi:uncharacterized protein LOC122523803 [Polistes fuscatus]|uniref:uncharacterized protein LOC122523803 n=1 Tax=Polistes fuscatus TaxID=30207 RepID=UPI001CA9CDB8|nr:uncharacterized protein LOC122523803 [Polistes fuscatus]